jgi:hypothetical protein
VVPQRLEGKMFGTGASPFCLLPQRTVNVWRERDRGHLHLQPHLILKRIVDPSSLRLACPSIDSALSPCFGRVNPTELAAWILQTDLPIRLQLQQHKILWDPEARGV